MTVTVRLLTDGCKIEDESQAVSFRLDAAGHWSTFRLGANLYRRCVDGRIVRGAAAEPLSSQQTTEIYQQAYQCLQVLNTDELLVHKSRSYSPMYYRQLSQKYFDVYPEPVTILPPDRYGDIVVQPAKGCPNRQCTFCAFYKEKPYSVLNREQLQHHFDGLEKLFGDAMFCRQGVFLGSANALALSQRRLKDCLELTYQRFGALKRGVAAFADPDFSAQRTREDWQELHYLGLRHVVIGLETGWNALRAKLGKSGQLDKAERMISHARSANISVGLTILTGATSEDDQLRNLQETGQFLQSLSLGSKDLVYLSPLDLSPLDQCGLVEPRAIKEQKLFADYLQNRLPAKVVSYQMQRFNYYT